MPDSKISQLRVVAAPSAEDEIRVEVVNMLKEALEQAERGEVSEIFMILKHPGTDEWSDRATMTQHLSEWIGKLEITKQSWITQFLKEDK